jgi:hypothetical protein
MNKLSKLSLVLANSLMVIFFSFIGINEVSAVTITGYELRLGPNFNKCLGISGRSKADGAVANVYDCMSTYNANDIEGRLSQMWLIKADNPNSFQLVNSNSGKCLSLDGSNEAIPISQRSYLQWGCIAGHRYQAFKLYYTPQPSDYESGIYWLILDYFRLQNPAYTNCMVIAFEYNEASVVNCEAPNMSGANTRWKFVPVTVNF